MTAGDPNQPKPMAKTKPRAFVFVGGGSGGHLYPMLAIIEQIRASDPGARIKILCSQRPIDETVLAPTGIDREPIPAQYPSTRPKQAIRFLRAWGPSVRAVTTAVREMRVQGCETTIVVTGGFVAAPARAAAKKTGAPLVLVSLDAVVGKANAWIAKRAARAFTAAPIETHPDWTRTTPIVRAALLKPKDQPGVRAELGLDQDRKVLLVTGGSQGARSINGFVSAFVREHRDALEGWSVLHQAGPDAPVGEIKSAYDQAGVRAKVVPYIDDMAIALAASDLVLGRCGAGGVAECWATKTPAAFFPYPYHADQHQRRNAKVLEAVGACTVLTDHMDPDKNLAAHAPRLAQILTDPAELSAMRDALEQLGPPDGARTIAAYLLG